MKNQTNDGIFCDYCGNESKGDFTYYSFDFYEITILNKFTRQADNTILSCDLCETCMELFRQRLLGVAGVVNQSPTRCDVTGKDFGSHDQVYYKCRISNIRVDLSGQVYLCSKCNKPRDPQEGPCDCTEDSRELIKVANIESDDGYLELLFCNEIFATFKKHIEYIRDLGEVEWP